MQYYSSWLRGEDTILTKSPWLVGKSCFQSDVTDFINFQCKVLWSGYLISLCSLVKMRFSALIFLITNCLYFPSQLSHDAKIRKHKHHIHIVICIYTQIHSQDNVFQYRDYWRHLSKMPYNRIEPQITWLESQLLNHTAILISYY